jgi:hypothetical protein
MECSWAVEGRVFNAKARRGRDAERKPTFLGERTQGNPRTQSCEFIDGNRPMWDNPTVIVTMDVKRRVSIPAALAPASPGDQFDASFDPEEDVVTLRRVKRKANWLKVWRECPVHMDDLPVRSREMPKKVKL